MGLITIGEQSIAANETTGTVTATAMMSFDHGPEYSMTVSDPFSKEEEAELEWYFEEHLCFPSILAVSHPGCQSLHQRSSKTALDKS